VPSDNPIENFLSLKDLIRHVKKEIIESQRESVVNHEDALFVVQGLTLEVNFIVTKSKGGTGGFEFKVLTFGGIKAGGDLEHQEQQIHKITLSLTVIPGHEVAFAMA